MLPEKQYLRNDYWERIGAALTGLIDGSHLRFREYPDGYRAHLYAHCDALEIGPYEG